MKPEAIETLSFSIIDQEAGLHGFPPPQWAVVRRMIHTSADFEYQTSIRFHPQAIAAGINAIRGGGPIFTDTNMARAGIRQRDLAPFGSRVTCLMTDPAVARLAAEQGTTRAQAAVETAAEAMKGGIYVVGNAPTALLHLIELVRSGRAAPSLIVGMPVGFVNAAESKAALEACTIPYITNRGRKGGSNVAAAVANALILLAGKPSAGEVTKGKRQWTNPTASSTDSASAPATPS